ncbi:MAG: chorismate synthase [Candidatus Altiarchaeales archaeon]|nr:chorismate synthase [Candidatus Altiarchaeales archaeon]
MLKANVLLTTFKVNTFGRFFRVTTWGESHGKAVGCVVDGCPSNLPLEVGEVQKQLDRRRPGQSSYTTSRSEWDEVEIHSGVFENKTLGTPISMMVRNQDVDSSKYEQIKNTPRPGHADFAWRAKYVHVDYRGGGRSSARETVGRVAAGAIALKLIQSIKGDVVAYTKSVGETSSEETLDHLITGVRDLIDGNPVRALDAEAAPLMQDRILEARKQKDSVGGVVEAVCFGVPPGLGEPVFGKLSSDLAQALCSIPAVKGVEFGQGFNLSRMMGSQANDEYYVEGGEVKPKTNHMGGILGGISTGQPIVVRVAVKPTASIGKTQDTVNLTEGVNTKIQVEGRHDPCILPRAVPVVESMIALVLADHLIASGRISRNLD